MHFYHISKELKHSNTLKTEFPVNKTQKSYIYFLMCSTESIADYDLNQNPTETQTVQDKPSSDGKFDNKYLWKKQKQNQTCVFKKFTVAC